MGRADRGIARGLQSRQPGVMLAATRRANSNNIWMKDTLWGAIAILGMVGLPKFRVQRCVHPMLFRAMERKVKATGPPRPSGGR